MQGFIFERGPTICKIFNPLHFLPEFVPHTEFKGRPEDAKWNVLNHTSFINYAPFSLQVPSILSILLALGKYRNSETWWHPTSPPPFRPISLQYPPECQTNLLNWLFLLTVVPAVRLGYNSYTHWIIFSACWRTMWHVDKHFFLSFSHGFLKLKLF